MGISIYTYLLGLHRGSLPRAKEGVKVRAVICFRTRPAVSLGIIRWSAFSLPFGCRKMPGDGRISGEGHAAGWVFGRVRREMEGKDGASRETEAEGDGHS